MEQLQDLIRRAFEMRNHSYAPYSKFLVGSALLCEDGTIFEGANVENAAYGGTICAERNAMMQAVCKGNKKFKTIVIAGGPAEGESQFAYPCGHCLQVMMEFCKPEDLQVVIAKTPNEYEQYSLAQMLPKGFGPSHLMK